MSQSPAPASQLLADLVPPEGVRSELVVAGGIEVLLFERSDSDLPAGQADTRPVAVVFLLHGRLESAAKYAPYAALLAGAAPPGTRLLVALLEQRNHGLRHVRALANRSWADGNPTHALDMWSVQYGTARDVSFLIDVLPLFLANTAGTEPAIPRIAHGAAVHWGVAGVSLGGHATLLAAVHDPRIELAVSVIGCGDNEGLMVPRARNNGLPTPPAADSPVTPALLSLLATHDPVHRTEHLAGKRILLLSGGLDTLVPASASARFVERARAVLPSSDAQAPGPCLVEIVDPKAKHEFSVFMKGEVISFTAQWLELLAA
ncbi:hypothetical protein HK105_205433 [Polyrhizophydium stewartii]|uniref:Uncharacterized protein n=1 Tax=Polyrhizophydium stewartii TaxID=2732419 RepID=A0ABR4N6K9_9FUNG